MLMSYLAPTVKKWYTKLLGGKATFTYSSSHEDKEKRKTREMYHTEYY